MYYDTAHKDDDVFVHDLEVWGFIEPIEKAVPTKLHKFPDLDDEDATA